MKSRFNLLRFAVVLILCLAMAIFCFACGSDDQKKNPDDDTHTEQPENPDDDKPDTPDDSDPDDSDDEEFDRGESGPVLVGDPYEIPKTDNAPEPYGPVPSASQMKYYNEGLSMFIHFGVNTFTDSEWGDGTENEDVFAPEDLDTDQWIKTAKDMGFGRVLLTSKHHDGFVLYPTAYTDHSVANSSWMDGKGDVVKSFIDSCEKYGVGAGIYLSPWDRNMECFGNDAEYNEVYVNMINEIFERYGNSDNSNIVEFWLDGAYGDDDTPPIYDYTRWWNTIYGHNKDIVIKSEWGSSVHWIGTHECDLGFYGDQNWQTYNKEYLWSGFPKKPSGFNEYINNGVPYIEGKTGKENANIWSVSEADISIRTTGTGKTGAWFWSPTDVTRSAENLADIYFDSVGRGGVFLLNVPPTTEGKFEQYDIDALTEFREILDNTFGTENEDKDKTTGAAVTADTTRESAAGSFDASNTTDDKYDTYWTTEDGDNSGTLTVEFDESVYMDVVELQEYIPLGQRIHSFDIDVRIGDQWIDFGEGTTIGYKRLVKGYPVTADAVRITVEGYDVPLINNIGVYKADSRIETEVEFTSPGTVSAGAFASSKLGAKVQTKGGIENVGSIKNGEVLSYEGVFFNGTPDSVSFEYAGTNNEGAKTRIKITVDSPDGTVLADCEIEPTGSYYNFAVSEEFATQCEQNIVGTHTVYLTITGEAANDNAGINLASFTFTNNNTVNFDERDIYAEWTEDGKVTVNISRASADLTDSVTVTLRTSDGSGKAGTDYTALSGSVVTFESGAKTASAEININKPTDGLYDFEVMIEDVGAGAYIGSRSSVVVTVVNPDSWENFGIGESLTTSDSKNRVTADGDKQNNDGIDSTVITIKGGTSGGAGKILTIKNAADDGFAPTGQKQVVRITVSNGGDEAAMIRFYTGEDDDLNGVTLTIPAHGSVSGYYSVTEPVSQDPLTNAILICTNFGEVPLTITGYVIG